MPGSSAITSSSGPGIALKGEAMGLAVMTELPLVIVNSQRGGPSTGLPTKTEQSDLYQAVYGRNGDTPIPVIAARSPADAFDCAIEACRIATRFMTPVMLLTDGYIANAAEPWKVPDMSGYAPFPVQLRDRRRPTGKPVMPYARNDELARPWIKPGTPGLEHRIGGIEKQPGTGNIDYSPAAHAEMTRIRVAKVPGVAKTIPDQDVCARPRRRGQARGRRLGLDLRPDPPGGAPRAGARAGRRPHPHPPHLADARQSRPTCCAGFEQDHRAGNEHGPVEDPAARPIPGRRAAAQQGQRPALPHRRDRGRDRGGWRWQ